LSLPVTKSAHDASCLLYCSLLQTVFELLCNLELIPEWDMLFKVRRCKHTAGTPAATPTHLHMLQHALCTQGPRMRIAGMVIATAATS
jgi:hypothetical protein